jgi:hypothetical protein
MKVGGNGLAPERLGRDAAGDAQLPYRQALSGH